MDWDLPQLRALAAAVDHGSLEAAARALHLTPSAVSQRIKALEQAAGAVLLRRSRPVAPTAAGEPFVRLARQIDSLTSDVAQTLASGAALPDGAGSDSHSSAPPQGLAGELRIAVNADSLATWALRALAPLARRTRLTFLREDEGHTTELLRDGTAMAAITSQATPVQGCTVERLGTMRYLPMASPDFAQRWFPDGVTPAALRLAPVVVFDDRDTLQRRSLDAHGITTEAEVAAIPTHVVPASTQFYASIRFGYGWGMLPQIQTEAALEAGELIVLGAGAGSDPGAAGTGTIDVTLYWQQWSLHTPSLDAAAATIRSAAAAVLT